MTLNEFLATTAAPTAQCIFMFAFGACVGSLINVLVYRLPRGLSVVAPPSRCPACQTRLTWRENIPVLGWLALGGRCRFCKSRISPEYPLVEAFVGLLFVLLFVLWYLIRPGSVWLGIDWGLIRPEWAINGFGRTWPAFITLLVLASCLVAMTLVDFKTFTIPVVLTTVPALLGIVAHTAHAAWIQSTTPGSLRFHAPNEVWTIATFGHTGWRWLGAGIGGMLGVGFSLLLLRLGLLRRPFADYDQWEAAERARLEGRPPSAAAAAAADAPQVQSPEAAVSDPDAAAASTLPPDAANTAVDPDAPVGPRHEPSRRVRESVLVYLAAIVALGAIGAVAARFAGVPSLFGLLGGALVGPIAAGVILRARDPKAAAESASPPTTDGGADSVAGDPDMWLAYPHARREMLKELVFVGPAIAFALAGAALFGWIGGPWTVDPSTGNLLPARGLPLWAVALGGSLMGYLIGGAVVWGVRIGGSLAFGKEAMGMGDVHLMAAVGACLGWIDATLAFFAAAFVGLLWVAASAARSGGVARAMPYGPYLAAATMLVVLAKPAFEWGLGRILGAAGPINLP